MEGVWRGSDVGRTTSWYCLTYKGSKTTPKYSFLITWIRLYWPPVPRRTGTDSEAHLSFLLWFSLGSGSSAL